MSENEKVDMVELVSQLKDELTQGDTERTQAFLDLVLSNGDVLIELENQLETEK